MDDPHIVAMIDNTEADIMGLFRIIYDQFRLVVNDKYIHVHSIFSRPKGLKRPVKSERKIGHQIALQKAVPLTQKVIEEAALVVVSPSKLASTSVADITDRFSNASVAIVADSANNKPRNSLLTRYTELEFEYKNIHLKGWDLWGYLLAAKYHGLISPANLEQVMAHGFRNQMVTDAGSVQLCRETLPFYIIMQKSYVAAGKLPRLFEFTTLYSRYGEDASKYPLVRTKIGCNWCCMECKKSTPTLPREAAKDFAQRYTQLLAQ